MSEIKKYKLPWLHPTLSEMLCCAMLAALGVVLKIWSINLTIGAVIISRVGFQLIAIYIAAILFGPMLGGITGAVIDIVGTIAFPVGEYNPAFTVTMLLTGVLIWLFYKLFAFTDKLSFRIKNARFSWLRLLLTVTAVQTLFVLPVNTAWISVFYGSEKSYPLLLISRLPQLIFYIPAFTVVLSALVPVLELAAQKMRSRRRRV